MKHVKQKKDLTYEIFNFLKDICIIVLLVFIVRTFLVMPFQINGQSMADSYYDREFIIVDRFSYRNIPFIGKTREIMRGDVVVFAPGVSEDRKYFIKRVIALPGEKLKIQDGRVYIQGVGKTDFQELDEGGYLTIQNNNKTTVRGDMSEIIYEIPDENYFVMGDNRAHSTDSRTCFQSCIIRSNYISAGEILGRVWFDLGYFHLKSFTFTHPQLDISTLPRAFSSPGTYMYE